jgi:tetratricopeptide (TPR) repeat protein
MNSGIKNFLALIFLLAVGFFVYANALPNGFLWDDQKQVVRNTVIRNWENIPVILTSSTFYAGGNSLMGSFYRPLVSLSYLVNYTVWGLDPFGFRLFQMFFHLFNISLIFFLLKKIFSDAGTEYGGEAAFLAALIFAVHPANVESVIYIGCIGEIFYAFFILLASLVFLKGIDRKNGSVKNINLILAFLLIFLGLLSKETAIVILPILLIYLLLFTKSKLSVYFKFIAGCGIATGAYLFLRFFVAKLPMVKFHLAPIALAPFWQRLLTIPYEIVSYLGIIFFPRDLSISRQFVVVSASDPKFWLAALFLAAVSAMIVFYLVKTKSKIVLFFLLWFAVALAPTLNIIPMDMTMAERWLYVPIIGISAVIGLATVNLVKSRSSADQKVFYGVVAILILAFGARTVVRNMDWKSGLVLFSHDYGIVSRISPEGSFDLESNYGVELLRAGKIDEAEKHLRKSVALQPKWASSQNNLGVILERQGDLEGALEHYEKSIKAGKRYTAYENKSNLLIELGRYDEARSFLLKSLPKFPQNNKLKLYLARIYTDDNTEKSREKALVLIGKILDNDPQNASAQKLYRKIKSSQ